MRKGGFEPPRSCERQPLKLVRLPVPPLPQRGDLQSNRWGVRADSVPPRGSRIRRGRSGRRRARSRRRFRRRLGGWRSRRRGAAHDRRRPALPENRQRQRAEHEEHREHAGRPRQERRTAAGAEGRLAAAAAERGGNVAAAPLLQEHDEQEQQAREHVEGDNQVVQHGMGPSFLLSSECSRTCRRRDWRRRPVRRPRALVRRVHECCRASRYPHR